MDYETVIGLEVHVQLNTTSKMFCGCAADYQTAPPNSRVCPVCLGLPGALPVINRQAVEYTIMTGLALGCRIPEYSKFDRKNYPYPDLMKGYQISQFDFPFAVQGCLEIQVDGRAKAVGVERVHLEEDVAKLQHLSSEAGNAYSLVDVNRSGVPLMEIVSGPDMRSPEEARAYLTTLHSIVQYLGVSTANMQDGSFRCDANISIRPQGTTELGTRSEVKNMNSFRSVFQALNYEVERQRRVVEDGGRVVQETRGWLEDRGVTFSQRSKEYAHDYRYFPEPDLPPLVVESAWVERLRAQLPELPYQRKLRFMDQYGLPEYDADLLTASRHTADYYEKAVGREQAASREQATGQRPQNGVNTGLNTGTLAKNVSNWMLGDLSRLMNLHGQEISQIKVTPAHLVQLISLIDGGTLSVSLAKTVLQECFESGEGPDKIVADKGYSQINDSSAVEAAVKQAIDQNPKAVADYRSGKETAARFLVGQVMKLTRGQAKPDLAQQLVLEGLEAAKGGNP